MTATGLACHAPLSQVRSREAAGSQARFITHDNCLNWLYVSNNEPRTSMTGRAFQFVDHSLPGDSAAERRGRRQIVRAQAARAAHAETRHQRIIAYQAAKNAAEHAASSSTQLQPLRRTSVCIQPWLSGSRADPFNTSVRPFKRTEYFLLDHCKPPPSPHTPLDYKVYDLKPPKDITDCPVSLDLAVVVPLMRCAELTSFYMDRMTRAWVPLALANRAFLDSLLLMASRHLSMLYGADQRYHFVKLASQYKLACIHSLQGAIADKPPFNDATVATVLMLAYDEVGNWPPSPRVPEEIWGKRRNRMLTAVAEYERRRDVEAAY